MTAFEWYYDVSGYQVCKVDAKTNKKVVGRPLDIEEVKAEASQVAMHGKALAAWQRDPTRWRITNGRNVAELNMTPRRWYSFEGAYGSVFQEFARLSPTVPEILVFANKYGLLASRPFDQDIVQGITKKSLWHAEPISTWVWQIYKMSWALKVWELAKAGDEHGLQEVFEFSGPLRSIFHKGNPQIKPLGVPACPWLESRHFVADFNTHPQYIARYLETRELKPFGFLYVEQMLNAGIRSMDEGAAEGLPERVPEPELTGTTLGRRHVLPMLHWDGQRFQLELRPDNLIGALWLQFAHAIAGGKSYANCLAPGCGRWIETGSRRGGRRTKMYCSKACGLRAFRRKGPSLTP